MLRHPHHLHLSFGAPALAAAGTFFILNSAFAQPIDALKVETPPAYIQVGLMVNPTAGDHPFAPVPFAVGPDCAPETCWVTPATLGLIETTVRLDGNSTHMIALHDGEDAPAPTWFFSIARSFPTTGPFAVGARTRRNILHAGADTHYDTYVAAVGAFLGTAPGPSLVPRFVIIGGTMGVHTDNPPPEQGGFEPIHRGSTLTPPSGLPSPGNQDFPAGQMVCTILRDANHAYMFMLVDGVQPNQITNVFIQHGQNGPIMVDLLPQIEMVQLQLHSCRMTLRGSILPLNIVNLIDSNQAYLSVRFTPGVHPDQQIGGMIKPVACKPGDLNCDGFTNVGDLLGVINQWGPCPPQPQDCPADLSPEGGDGVVGVPELLLVISNWG